jgi:hypothetical protein
MPDPPGTPPVQLHPPREPPTLERVAYAIKRHQAVVGATANLPNAMRGRFEGLPGVVGAEVVGAEGLEPPTCWL